MAHRKDHYEKAFEDYLQAKDSPYVVVDEAKKKSFAAVRLKTFDFLVYSARGPNLLVEVKGRKFPDLAAHGRRRSGRAWENWVTREDIEGLRQWEHVFGESFRAVLVFAYWLQGAPEKTPLPDVHLYQQRHYAFVAAALAEYVALAKPRSIRWKTLNLSTQDFSRLARDIAEFL